MICAIDLLKRAEPTPESGVVALIAAISAGEFDDHPALQHVAVEKAAPRRGLIARVLQHGSVLLR